MNWAQVKDLGARFENLVACHLLKWVCYQEDCFGRELELRYFRDVDLREVDFVVLEDQKPILFVEVKTEHQPIVRGLYYLKARFPEAHAYQIAWKTEKDYLSPEGIRACPAMTFLLELI